MQLRNRRGLSVFIARKQRVYDMYENTKGVKALGTVLRQKLEVSQEIPAEMLVLLLRLARADMARLPRPQAQVFRSLGSARESSSRSSPGDGDRAMEMRSKVTLKQMGVVSESTSTPETPPLPVPHRTSA